MHAWLVPYGKTSLEYPSPLSLTGKFVDDGGVDEEHILGAGHMHQVWRQRRDVADNADRVEANGPAFLENQHYSNAVCYQGHQFSYNRKSGQHDIVTRNTGHWGPNVYPGCGAVRAG